GHIFIRQSLLAARIGLLGLDAGSGNIVKLRQQTDPIVLLLEREKTTAIVSRQLGIVAIMGIQKEIRKEEWPLTLDVLEDLKLARLVMQTAVIFQDRLMPITKKPLAAIVALQQVND